MKQNKNGSVMTYFKDLFWYIPHKEYNFTVPEANNDENATYNENSNNYEAPKNLFPNISKNLEIITTRYNAMINSDIIIREFNLIAKNKEYKAFILYIDGMVDTKIVNQFVLDPLMLRNQANTYTNPETDGLQEVVTNHIVVRKVKKFDLSSYILNHLIPQNSVKQVDTFDDVSSSVNSGNCLLFVDTLNIAFDIDAKGFKQRSVGKPENEIVIRGSQEGFTENIRTNTSLLRRLCNNEKLIIENLEVGNLTKTKCAICYMKNIANNDLIAEVKYRINNISVDSIISSGQLEQLISDNGKFSIPQMVSTERPDNATNFLLSGRVIILVNGSPYALIAPGTFIDFISSPEDLNLKYKFSNLLKLVRILAILLTLLLPGFYVAITNFHQELLPTELLFAIVASRENIPLPIIFEILVMEISFELIREAGIRVPSPLGPTIGIVGALILGQAAVDANIVSPILIIVVAITAIASFAIPDYSFSFHFRLARFIYIIFGYALGFLGIATCLFFHFLLLVSLSSFGYPYLQPYVPVTKDYNGLLLSPVWKREHRADFLNTKRPKKQPDVSMKWKYPNK